jgi:amino acid adenylation domain-containing protein
LPEHESGWNVSQLDVQTGTTKFDLTVELEERKDGIVGRFQYRHDLFDATTILGMIQHSRCLLEVIASDPDRRIADLPMAFESTAVTQPRTARPPQSAQPPRDCIHGLFEAQAQSRPDALAITFDGQQMTYGTLNRRANRLAHRLRRMGVGPNTLVAICMERSPEMLVGILGILKAGGAYVPLDPLYPKKRLAVMLDDARPTVLVTSQLLRDRLPRCDAAIATMENAEESGDRGLDENPDCQVQPEHLAYVIYTSGSTGKPKGVMVSHFNVVRLLTQTEPIFHFGPEDVWTLFHSSAFDFSVWEMWGALLFGGRLVVVPHWLSRTPDAFWRLLVEEKVTVLNQTPSAFLQLLSVEGTSDLTEHALRLIVFGGEALELSSLRPWFERHGQERPELVNMYGITETTVHTTFKRLTTVDLSRERGSPIGVPLPDLRLYLLDSNLQPVPEGVAGEIYVGGAGVAQGYLNHPQLTAERFICNPFTRKPDDQLYRSGDLARYLPDGMSTVSLPIWCCAGTDRRRRKSWPASRGKDCPNTWCRLQS